MCEIVDLGLNKLNIGCVIPETNRDWKKFVSIYVYAVHQVFNYN